MQQQLASREVVLLGVGHTNAHVLRQWKMKPPADARLTCLSNFSQTTYSGMLPGVLAGQYQPEQMTIDLVRLCASAGARLIVNEVSGLDTKNRTIQFTDRTDIPFDILSIGIGSVPSQKGLEASDETLVPIKPMQTFGHRLEERLLETKKLRNGDRPIRIAIVGGGVGGVEIAFCLASRIEKAIGETPFEISLIHSGDELPAASAKSMQRIVKAELQRRNVQLILNSRVVRATNREIELEGGEVHSFDCAIWATGAAAPLLLNRFQLPKDDRGFLLTQSTLQVQGQSAIFAVGDTGTIENEPTLKAGVFAVRQGPVLWRNILNMLRGGKLEEYSPQRRFLKILNTGDGQAVAEYAGFSWRSTWCMKLKDRIDVKFMEMYQDYNPMKMKPNPMNPESGMRCAGCGGKVGASVLRRALERIEQKPNKRIVVGLDAPDDDALFHAAENRLVSATTDFFAPPVDDAYTAGRIAALNSASDAFASGARPVTALAMATLPYGSHRQQQQMLYEFLAGAVREFDIMGATIAGGHTIEGPQAMIGFTVLSDQPDDSLAKDALKPGDQLILTKPLGSGVLLAAHMLAECRWQWREILLRNMLISNQHASTIARQHGVRAATDVTGFGLAGHLLEMLKASHLPATIRLDELPLLPGANKLLKSGLESTLAPANRVIKSSIEANETVRARGRFAALFDPQTSGGLLLAVVPSRTNGLLVDLHAAGLTDATIIGEVGSEVTSRPVLGVV